MVPCSWLYQSTGAGVVIPDTCLAASVSCSNSFSSQATWKHSTDEKLCEEPTKTQPSSSYTCPYEL
jgi:hypothetical protein